MAEQHLDHTDVDAALQKVGCKTMAQGMRTDALGDTSSLCGIMNNTTERDYQEFRAWGSL